MSVEKPKTVELYIYSAVEGDSYDWCEDKVIKSETSADFFREKLEECGEVDNINIYINSLGGSVKEGTAIYNQLRRCKAYKTVYVDGFACSIASVIAMAGDKVVMPANTVMMIHNAWTYTCGNAKQLRKQADDLEVLNEAARQAYLLKSGDKLAEEKLTEMLEAETYLTAKQCIEYGLADEYAEVEADLETAKQMFQEAKQSNINQYANMIEKVCALAKPPVQASVPAPPQDPPKEEDFKEKAIQMFNEKLGGSLC